MARYIKTEITEFEQFDGSEPMSYKYHLRFDRSNGRHHEPVRWFIGTLEGEMRVQTGDWIATGVNGEHWPVKDEIFQKTYKKLPTIPKDVSYAIEWFEQNDDDLGKAFRNTYEDLVDDWQHVPQLKAAETWIINHPNEFARAWLDGYEVAE